MWLNRSLARMFFGEQSPLGQSVRIGDVPWQVVGVIDDVRTRGLDTPADPQAYVDPDRLNEAARAAGWDRFGFDAMPAFLSFAVRVDGDPTSIVADVRNIVRRLDASAGIDGAIAMERVVSGALARPRFYAALVGLFAGLAAVLAAVGVYGVLSYQVALRAREIGIRMALGAERRQVTKLVIRDAAGLTAAGLALGTAGAAALTRYLRGLLFGIAPLDPTTFAGAALLLVLIAALASWAPARRAAAVDPLTAIRCD
jgi:predicted lysophospholipase L1 biosynthesis ABC-type transport system permease subunit